MKKTKISQYNEQIIESLKLFFDGHLFIIQHKLYRHLIITGIIFILIFTVGLTYLIRLINWTETTYTDDIQHFLTTYINLNSNYINYNFEELII